MTTAVTPDELLALLCGAVATVLEVDPAGLSRGTRFKEDLRADSLALVEIVEIVEEGLAGRQPGFRLEDERLDDLRTLGDAVDYALDQLA